MSNRLEFLREFSHI